jgi:hypothetical protein
MAIANPAPETPMPASFVQYRSGRDVVEFSVDVDGKKHDALISGEALSDHFSMRAHTSVEAQVAFEMNDGAIAAVAVKLIRRGRAPHIGTGDI